MADRRDYIRHLAARVASEDDFVRGRFGLWLPQEYTRGSAATPDPPAMPFVVTTVGWSELFPAVSQDALLDRIKRYSLRELTALVARVCLALEAGSRRRRGSADLHAHPLGALHATQEFILNHFLGHENAARLWDRVRDVRGADYEEGRVAFFQERQALNLLKLALLVVDSDAPDRGDSPVAFLEALLMLHDYLEPRMSGVDMATVEGRAQWELYMFAASCYYAGTHDLHDQVRAHYLYIDPPSAVVTRPGAVDLPGLLAQATGMPAASACNAMFGVYVAWGVRDIDDLVAGQVAESRSRFFATLSGVSPTERDRWFALATADVRELQERVQSRYTLEDPRYFDVLVFEQTPIVAFGDTLYCVSLHHLKRLGTTGLQHRLLDPAVFDAHQRRAFLDTRGYAVEQYVLDLLSRAFGPRLVGELRLREIASGRKVCEAIAVYADAAILFEVKAVHPTLDARHGIDYRALRSSWKRHMQPAADQLESTAMLLEEGVLRDAGLDPDQIRRVYPVVITFESPVSVLGYRAVCDVDLAGHPLMHRIEKRLAAALTLLDINDVEMLEVALEHGAEALSLLQEKTSSPELAELPFDNFLRLRGDPYVGRHSEWHQERFTQISEERRAFFRARGLPLDDPVDGSPSAFS